ncbi:TPA: lysozyme family protein [Bacillus cereus]|uniref:Lysozyme family protein n=8 Tax=Bacillus cereus group TaxID=86661 RepID=A0A0B5P0Q3_BACTU|nr:MULTISPECIES: lysozyme family protein [Bacillus cereus group]AJG78043.1 lysozyme-like family protein [Bacillus thuringiensis]MCU5696017.1 lysozyme family protein [Bacillus cereus]QKH23237.1 lysozyme family protein [Bacillus thuringiensis]TBX95685.1 lysozyme family protein [Bacillus cereus]
MGMLAASVKTKNLPQRVLRWQTMVENECNAQGVPELVPYVLGIIMVESDGNAEQTPDIMQSSESQGRPMNSIDNPKESIHYGVMHLIGAFADAKKYGITDLSAIVQTYNFGRFYIRWLASNNKQHSLQVAEQYSKTVVAPSLGNSTGAMIRYSHPIAVAYNGGYKYKNGGNFFYAEIVKQYVDFVGGVDPTDVDTRKNVTLPSDWLTNNLGWLQCVERQSWVYKEPNELAEVVGKIPLGSGHVYLETAWDGKRFWFKIANDNWVPETVMRIEKDGRSKGVIWNEWDGLECYHHANYNSGIRDRVSVGQWVIEFRDNNWIYITDKGWVEFDEKIIRWIR